MVDSVMTTDLETLRDFVRQASSAPQGICGDHAVHTPQYSDRQVKRAMDAADRAIIERQRHDTPAWEANERLNGTVETLCGEIERLRARIAEMETALHRIVDAPNLDVMTTWAIAHGALGDAGALQPEPPALQARHLTPEEEAELLRRFAEHRADTHPYP